LLIRDIFVKVWDMKNMSKPALFFAIAGIICNILIVNIGGIPVSIPLGIFGIAFSILCKDADTNKLTSRGKAALILSIIALVFGMLIFIIAISTAYILSDPEMSRAVIDTIKPVKDQLPENMLQMFEKAGISLD